MSKKHKVSSWLAALRTGTALERGWFCSTIAVAMLGLSGHPAHAQTKVEPIRVTVGGFHGQFLSYINQDDVGTVTNGTSGKLTQFDVSSDSEIHFNGRTTLDNGMTIGFRVELEGNTDSDQIDETYMFVEGKFGRISSARSTTSPTGCITMHQRCSPGAG